jgi:hypothetical protein
VSGEARHREWRQFRLLLHDSVKRLLTSAVLAREADPWQFAIWVTAIVCTPPWMYTVSKLFKYAVLRLQGPEVVERVLANDRMFFVVYGMVAAVLLAALTWEALVPDRTDQEILGVLPVRPRTVAAARLTGAITMVVAFAVAINGPTAIFFSLIAARPPFLFSIPALLFTHMMVTTAGMLTVFLALLIVRGLIAITLSDALANVTAGLLQLASVSAMIEAFVYVPSLVPLLVRTMIQGGSASLWIPPVWFTALYSVMAGQWQPALVQEAQIGGAVFGLTSIAAVIVYLAPAAWIARRALTTLSTQRTRYASAIIRWTSCAVAPLPRVRALIAFTIASLTRSRRHVFVLLGYLGAAVAIAAISVFAATIRRTVSFESPAAYLLSLPLVLIFFTVLGLRTTFRIAIDLGASWPFRISRVRSPDAAAAARLTLMALGVLPFALAAMTAAFACGWGARVALELAAFDLLIGLVLVEAVTYGWHAIPFARAYAPSTHSVRWRGPAMLVPLNVFAFRGADAQFAALDSPHGVVVYAAVLLTVVVLVGAASRRTSASMDLTFETDSDDSMQTLGLSDAL